MSAVALGSLAPAWAQQKVMGPHGRNGMMVNLEGAAAPQFKG